LLLAAILACGAASAARAATPNPHAADSFFEEKIRPVLAQSCYSCHSARATKIKGGLTLDTKDSALKGGKSGVAIVAGNPDASPLMKAIRRVDPDSAMPPEDKDKLSAEAIANIEKWIKSGALFPDAAAPEPRMVLKSWWEEINEAHLRPAGEPIAAVVDHYINAKLKEAGVTPANPATDANFIRRVTLDLTGRIPTPAEVKQYDTSTQADKKQQLVDRLMASPAFLRQQVTELNWMLMDARSGTFRDYLTQAVKENRGWDAIFRDAMAADSKNAAAKGSEQFLKARVQDLDRMTTDVSVRFFGVNISCAQCHNHPYVPAWTQDQYYGMKSFFGRTFDAGEFIGERDYGYVTYKPTKQEKTQRAPLLFIDGQSITDAEVAEPDEAAKKKEREALEALKKKKEPPPPPAFSRRAKLVEAGLSPGKEGFFARAIVNQTWARFFGQGLVMPVDQMHGQNKPSHPELLVWLAREMVRQKYDLKTLVRGLVLSDAYARNSE
jgi:mono/diheme cytochrome c family protein